MNLKPEIISVGDDIPAFYYKPEIHSTFNNIINFTYKDKIISVCNENKEKGPNNIVIKSLPIESIKRLYIYDNLITVNNTSFEKNHNQSIIYKSTLKIESNIFKYNKYKNNIIQIKDFLLQTKKNKTLLFLIDIKRKAEFQTNIEKSFVHKMENGINKILKNDIISGIKEIKGLGFGLTPSGDDFITGFLAILHIFQNVNNYKIDFINHIYIDAKTKNHISNTFLYYAVNNRYYENFKILLENILFTNYNPGVIPLLKKVIALGNTSGIDFLTGFLIGNKLFFNIF